MTPRSFATLMTDRVTAAERAPTMKLTGPSQSTRACGSRLPGLSLSSRTQDFGQQPSSPPPSFDPLVRFGWRGLIIRLRPKGAGGRDRRADPDRSGLRRRPADWAASASAAVAVAPFSTVRRSRASIPCLLLMSASPLNPLCSFTFPRRPSECRHDRLGGHRVREGARASLSASPRSRHHLRSDRGLGAALARSWKAGGRMIGSAPLTLTPGKPAQLRDSR
jgi:hypothetical protein